MTNALAIQNFQPMKPTPAKPQLAAEITKLRLALMVEGEGKFSLSQTMAPSVATRRELAARVDQIGHWLVPAGHDLTAREVASVLLTKPLRNVSPEEAEAVAQIYVADLQELPHFALAEACKAFRQNRAGEGKWAPTQGEIFEEAQKAMRAAIRERADIRSILTAQIEQPKISPERKAEVLASIKRAGDSRRADMPERKPRPDVRAVPEEANQKTIEAAIDAELERKAEEYRTRPVGLSDQALRAVMPSMADMREII